MTRGKNKNSRGVLGLTISDRFAAFDNTAHESHTNIVNTYRTIL